MLQCQICVSTSIEKTFPVFCTIISSVSCTVVAVSQDYGNVNNTGVHIFKKNMYKYFHYLFVGPTGTYPNIVLHCSCYSRFTLLLTLPALAGIT